MKIYMILATMLFSLNGFAMSVLVCESEGGTRVAGILPKASDTIYSVQLTLPGSEMKMYPYAHAQPEVTNGQVTFMVIKDPLEGILAVLKDDTLYLRTGTYKGLTCEIR